MGHLKSIYLAGAAAAVCASAAYADSLHGFCSDCASNLGVLTTATNPPMDFGFWNAGSHNVGTYFLDILTPDNGGSAPSGSFMVSGTMGASGTASLFGTSAWTSGKLDSFLGISASPANPLNPLLTATKTVDSSAMGYWVFQANLGHQTLATSSTSTSSGPVLNLGSGLPKGSFILAFLEGTTKGNTATANSETIMVTTGTPPSVPEPASLGLLAMGLAGLGLFRRKGRKAEV